MPPLSSPQDYHVGWICAMQAEYVVAPRIPSTKSIRPRLTSPLYDNNTYTFGHIGHHNVVIACLPKGKLSCHAKPCLWLWSMLRVELATF
jgi:hypothetical protein